MVLIESIEKDIKLYFAGLKQFWQIMEDHNLTRYKLNIILRAREKETDYVQYFDIHALVTAQIEKERAAKKLSQAPGSDEYWEKERQRFLNSNLVNKRTKLWEHSKKQN